MKRLADYVLLLVVATIISSQVAPCRATIEDCTGLPIATQVGDNLNCNNYFVCVLDGVISTVSASCAATDKCFDNVNSGCSTSTANCYTACALIGNKCLETCPSNGDGLIADPNDCGKFKECSKFGDPITRTCKDIDPARPYFDGFMCRAEPDACCNCQIKDCATAGGQGAKIADPKNCHAYYMCDGNNIPQPKRCNGEEEIFREEINGCDPGWTKCEEPCGSGTSPISPTSPTSPPDGCLESTDPCPDTIDHARCGTSCDSSYFSCASVDSKPTPADCLGDKVFNPTPDYPYCVHPSDCPVS